MDKEDQTSLVRTLGQIGLGEREHQQRTKCKDDMMRKYVRKMEDSTRAPKSSGKW